MTESVEWERLADHEEAPRSAAGAVAPMSDERLAEIRDVYADDHEVIGELLSEVERLNTVLDANRVVRNAAESSSRTLKGVVELLKKQRTQLRDELTTARGAMEILRGGGKEQCTRAETAEAERDAAKRELAEVRAALDEDNAALLQRACAAERYIDQLRVELNRLSGVGIVPTVQVAGGDEAPRCTHCGSLGFCEGGPECLDDEGGPLPQEGGNDV